MSVSVIMYKKFGVDNNRIALFTSLLYLPWVIKPLWGPLVDLYGTKRNWIVWLQLLLGVFFVGMGGVLQSSAWWWGSLAVFVAAAFTSATHDIAADGFYMLGLDEHKQAVFVGIRSTFYRIAIIFGNGILLVLVGFIESSSGPTPVQVNLHSAPDAVYAQQAPPVTSKDYLHVSPSTLTLAPGTTTSVAIKLNQQPDKDVVVSLSRIPSKWYGYILTGVGTEQLLKVSGGDRLVFTPKNWDTAQQVTVEADKSIAKETSPVDAAFKVSAGNIPLSWGVCFFGMGALFVMLFLYHHAFALPKPATDGARVAGEVRAPFARAATWLALTVIVPILVMVGMFYGLKPLVLWAAERMLSAEMFKNKNLQELYTFVTNIAIIAVIWGAYRFSSVRSISMSAFRGAAARSGMPFDNVFISFFSKPGIGRMIAFLLLYRLGESMIVKMAGPFLIDSRDAGGIGLSTAQYGLAYGTVGVFALLLGGILGGMAAASGGLKKWLFWMCLAINLPHLLYVYLAYAKPDNFMAVVGCVAGEQFSYGFGFAAYMLYMIYIAGEGEHKTSHFALATGFMALGMMLPGMFAGALQQALGYPLFFVLVTSFIVIGLVVIQIIPLDPEFGKKKKAAEA